ncbi:hypothetical protein BBJ28_00012585 [Nothophytophthora sp. Chile5]|nr:hypothetical protein BBJ28_00012585 [Nothophytophthora sp. Chile5]
MTRLGFVSLMAVLMTFAATVSGAPAGLLTNILAPVTTVVTTAIAPKDVVVVFWASNTAALGSVNATANILTETERVANIVTLVSALKLLAQTTQAGVLALLTGLIYEIFWINNTILIKNCPSVVVGLINALPEVKEIVDNLIITLDPIQPTADSTSNTAAAGWGATKIQAPNVWASGFTGQNVVVATIDSGVRGTHEALNNNFLGPYGWYDPANKTATPYDDNGHGTHTMGSIAGGLGVGIAPGVKWMTCKGCGSTSCSLSLLTACAQFVLCPTDTAGNNCNAAKAPHIVSNSWGAGQGLTYFQSNLDAWYSARIIPVFATGNSGSSGCSSVVSPSDSAKAFAVGATDINDALGSFSSLGPALNGLVKPNFAGPGVSIRSAWNGNNSDYLSLSGTSMAAPHLAGTIALALSARSGFCFDSMKTVLSGSTDQTLPKAALTCGGTTDTTFPNNQYGYGRINALSAVNAAVAY